MSDIVAVRNRRLIVQGWSHCSQSMKAHPIAVAPKRQHRQAQIHSRAAAVIFSQNCTRRVRDIVPFVIVALSVVPRMVALLTSMKVRPHVCRNRRRPNRCHSPHRCSDIQPELHDAAFNTVPICNGTYRKQVSEVLERNSHSTRIARRNRRRNIPSTDPFPAPLLLFV